MAESCCYLVGSYEVNVEGIISITTRSSTETTLAGDNSLVIGPTIGNVSVTAYVAGGVHTGCSARATVTIPWLRKYDCDRNILHFIWQGQGSSSISGPVGTAASLNTAAVSYGILNASAASGPATIYSEVQQHDGYGLTYSDGPYNFDTAIESSLLIDTGISSFGPMYLTSFTYSAEPAQIPTVSYEFLRIVGNDVTIDFTGGS